MSDATAENAARFQTYLDEKLGGVYETAAEALDAAEEIESYYSGVTITRGGNGYELEEADMGGIFAEAPVTEEGCDFDGLCFYDGEQPDAYLVRDAMNVNRWEDLTPVEDLLEGKADAVTIRSMPVTGVWSNPDPDGDDLYDDTGWWLVCAWRED